MPTIDQAQPALRVGDIEATLRVYRRRRDEGWARGDDVSDLERDIEQLEGVLAAFSRS